MFARCPARLTTIAGSSPRRTADYYRPQSVNAHLAAALHALTQVIDCTGLAHAGVGALIEHLRSWPSVTPKTFDAWYAYESPTLDTALGDPLAKDLEQESRRAGVDPADLRQLLENTAEIVYDGLFSTPADTQSLAHLRAVERIASRYTNAPAVWK